MRKTVRRIVWGIALITLVLCLLASGQPERCYVHGQRSTWNELRDMRWRYYLVCAESFWGDTWLQEVPEWGYHGIRLGQRVTLLPTRFGMVVFK